MFYIFTLASAAVTFSYVLLAKKFATGHHLVIGRRIVHHSCLAIFVLILGLFIVPESAKVITTAIGAGIYLSHIAEEIYFVKTSIWWALFVFIIKISREVF